MCKEMRNEGARRVRQFTPVDTSELRDSWYETPVLKGSIGGEAAYMARVASDLDRAAHTEYGTGLWGPSGAKYEIKPKPGNTYLSWKAKKPFTDKNGKTHRAGTRVYAQRVMHPGSKGKHMMARAVAYVEAQGDYIMDDVLRSWAREQERAFVRGGK